MYRWSKEIERKKVFFWYTNERDIGRVMDGMDILL